MPSATTAESSDSIAASRATVTADGKSSRTRSSETAGRLGAGMEAWISPKREPIVSTGSPSAATAADAARIATIGPGTLREIFGQRRRIANEPAATPIAGSDAEERCLA